MKILKLFIVILIVIGKGCWVASLADSYRNQVFTPLINSAQVYLNDNQLDLPIMEINSSDVITVSFDWLSLEYEHLAYRIEHCNWDWAPSGLDEMDYVQGINEVIIEDYYTSSNTTTDYTNYSFTLPNDNVQLLLSGNYVVKIFNTDEPEKILMTQCFSIEEPKISLNGEVSGKSIYGVNSLYQRLMFEITFDDGFSATSDELKIVIRQNDRRDNEVKNISPTYILPNSLKYEDERLLNFEGGVEYKKLDFSHRFRYSGEIERISFHHPYYHVEVFPGKAEIGKGYEYDIDVNGKRKINAQDVWSNAEIDYSIVHFTYPLEEPWLDGAMYVIGGFNGNYLDATNKMTYNFERKQYELALLLKNGGYNYQYLFLPAGNTTGTLIRSMGSHWETENEYQIYVYYRNKGGYYDQLIGFYQIGSVQR
ncbi:MAG: DUF5103 domain-containing protein [Paludibacteraceae bacterium]|nr:DUF5103 domain-containing protein [Paludibacteraceae bacterium]